MISKSNSKWQRIVATVIFMPILICLVAFFLTACIFPHEDNISYNEAIAIAKKDFGCGKILWIGNTARLSSEPWDILYEKISGSQCVYYVIGEKDGEEIYILIPSNTKRKDPFVTTWAFDYSFSQIVEKFNECGAQYVADVPDDYFDGMRGYIDFAYGEKNTIKQTAGGCLDVIKVDFDTFYDNLDVKAVFYYERYYDEDWHSFIVTQENGELKAYKK